MLVDWLNNTTVRVDGGYLATWKGVRKVWPRSDVVRIRCRCRIVPPIDAFHFCGLGRRRICLLRLSDDGVGGSGRHIQKRVFIYMRDKDVPYNSSESNWNSIANHYTQRSFSDWML